MRHTSSPEYLNLHLPKEVDEQLSSQEELLNQVIENADGVSYQIAFGLKEGEGYYINQDHSMEHLLGLDQGRITEKLFMQMTEELVPLDDDIPPDITDLHKKIISGELRKFRAEVRVITPSGDRKWLKDCAIAVSDPQTGRVTGLRGVLFDITEKKELEQQLTVALEHATESDRLKTAFLNNLSHEIRTPLNAIVGFSTLLGEPGNEHGNRMEFMDIITHSSDHLLEIVDDVLEISKIETKIVRLNKKEVNLNQLLERVLKRFKPAAEEKNLTLELNIPQNEHEINIFTDGYKLFQSVTNLISNAVKFTFEGKVEFGYHFHDGLIEFYVRDTGIGIGPEHQPNIFKPFYQAESSSTKRYEGTGLGLSIAKAYIELLGGNIWFSSEYGKGSEFRFIIPDTRL